MICEVYLNKAVKVGARIIREAKESKVNYWPTKDDPDGGIVILFKKTTSLCLPSLSQFPPPRASPEWGMGTPQLPQPTGDWSEPQESPKYLAALL